MKDRSIIKHSSNNGQMQLATHDDVIQQELDWIESQIQKRVGENDLSDISEEPFELDSAPDISQGEGKYADFIRKHDLSTEERALLMFAFLPEAAPDLMERLYVANNQFRLQLLEGMSFGLPTPETFLRFIGGSKYKERAKWLHLFDTQHVFYQQQVIELDPGLRKTTRSTAILRIESDFLDLMFYDEYRIPQFSPEFPANLVETNYTLKQVRLETSQIEKLAEIRAAIDYDQYMRNELGLDKDMTPGYMALFYGEPGTGKTLTASVLGNVLKMKVFEVNVSNLISKYIGETTKNLDRLFRKASGKNWILVFNEADCLFGKRSHANNDDDAGASHANQTISYLLDAIPRHKGVIILTTNMRHNFDKAFGRRIAGEIHFKLLDKNQAAEYLKEHIPEQIPLERTADLKKLFDKQIIGISIASLNNVIQRAIRRALAKSRKNIAIADLELCLKDEMRKVK